MPQIRQNKKKIFNDPVYGFIGIPDELLFDLVEHPDFQRLRRIKQLGLTHLVYPGALHTRFHHSLGAMHLMQQAIATLRSKGQYISPDEAQAVSVAILLHDIGHGPYSHTLEQSIVAGIPHEKLSLLFMQKLNHLTGGRLEMALAIFQDTYPKKILHQLVSSQLDMDRIDYLKRDSFFTGVSEGVINAERLITMLDVVHDELVVEAKGIYSVEKFIVARRLMYWQVYLHKTVLSAEFMLLNALRRAKELSSRGATLFATPALSLFLKQDIQLKDMEQQPEILDRFAELDDFDLFTALKVWQNHPDQVLSYLSQCIVNRQLFRVVLSNEAFDAGQTDLIKQAIGEVFTLPAEEAAYLLINNQTSNHAYHPNQPKINILFKDGTVQDIREASDQLNISVLSMPVTKHFLCYPKSIKTPFDDLPDGSGQKRI
ncbi:MAG: HD domain-containing protein [Bacteroidetes bacterium]|nr:HD domain-containing protein [Bacteroidota bacterium]